MDICNMAKAFGCHDLVLLNDTPHPKHLEYLDLLKPSRQERLRVNAIAEFQDRPLLYIVSVDHNKNFCKNDVLKLQCLLANRGERAFLGVLGPGDLNVYPVSLNRSDLESAREILIKKESTEAPFFFQSIVNGSFTIKGHPEEPDYVFTTINELMTRSSKHLIETYNLNPLDVLSFLGRSLFFRFLLDRKIVRHNELNSICPHAKTTGDCFFNVKNSIATCKWLDETFNGDMLPFSSDYTSIFNEADERTEGKIFLHLQAILEGWKHAGTEAFQQQIDWRDLDFAHIPIGVLSQVYENFSKIWDSYQREQTSAYYTPKNIARYIVDDAFEGVSNKKDARILDASCGAGIFLVIAFRKLVAARWEHEGKRPDTRAIQSILYNQICGFDVSESALRLAALSLYITAIELNGAPRPPKSLKFPEPLQGKVLYNHRRPDEQENRTFILGSLAPSLKKDFNGRFDIVIGNPPWSRLKGSNEKEKKNIAAHNKVFTELTRQILADRGLQDIAKKYQNPDNNPDLPFLWKSTQWLRQGGVIALALPGRIFLKQTESGIRAFNAILHGIEITGILNGSNLSDTMVWPGMNQPFMLFFARNQVPKTNQNFYFVTPHYEKNLNSKGRIRIDYQSAQPITTSEVIKDPHLLKTLSIGTTLDLEVVRKIDNLNWPNVKSYWKKHGLYSGLGYNRSPKLRQSDAQFMYGLPDFISPADSAFSIDISILPKFTKSSAHMPRRIELYTPPLLIVPESPGSSPFSAKSWIAREPIVFRKSYYGFSSNGSKEPDLVIALLHLITHSELFRYHVLMTSSRMGAERRTFLKQNIENFPFPTDDLITKKQKQCALELSNALEGDLNKPWNEINDFIFQLYHLDIYDRQVVKDTLEVAVPFKESRDRANAPPTEEQRNSFYSELQKYLKPAFDISGETISAKEIHIPGQTMISPWRFFTIFSKSSCKTMQQKINKVLISRVTKEANNTGCSRVIIHGKECLQVGIISQYRYWTLSRARLCALHILRQHLDAFPLGRK